MSGRQVSKRRREAPGFATVDEMLRRLDELERIRRGRLILEEQQRARRGAVSSTSQGRGAPSGSTSGGSGTA